MSWEDDFRRNIERTRQRIMEIAPDMLDLKAHHSAAGRPPPRTGAQSMPGKGTRPSRQCSTDRLSEVPQRGTSCRPQSRDFAANVPARISDEWIRTPAPTRAVASKSQRLPLSIRTLPPQFCGERASASITPAEQSNAQCASRSRREDELSQFCDFLSSRLGATADDCRIARMQLDGVCRHLNPAVLYSPIFGDPSNPGAREYLNGIASVICDADYGSEVRATTMIVGPMSVLPYYYDHPVILALCFVAVVRQCKVAFLYSFTKGPNEKDDAAYAEKLTLLLATCGVLVKPFNADNPITDGASSHCKFVLVSKTLRQDLAFPPFLHDVVAQSSGNMYSEDSYVWQDALVTYGKRTVYELFVENFATLWFASPGSDGFPDEYEQDEGVHAYFTPNIVRSISLNPYRDVLSRLRRGPGTSIRVAVSYANYDSPFFLDVAALMSQHVQMGSSVRFIMSPYLGINEALDFAAVKAAVNELRVGNMHNKYMLVSGMYLVYFDPFAPLDTSKWIVEPRQLILTGSLNLQTFKTSDSCLVIDPATDCIEYAPGQKSCLGSSWEKYSENFETQWISAMPK